MAGLEVRVRHVNDTFTLFLSEVEWTDATEVVQDIQVLGLKDDAGNDLEVVDHSLVFDPDTSPNVVFLEVLVQGKAPHPFAPLGGVSFAKMAGLDPRGKAA